MKLKGKARARARAKAFKQAQANFKNLPEDIRSGFAKDFGQVCHDVGKTRYDMGMQRWALEMVSSNVNKMPHRIGEYTMTVGYGQPVKEYCATWGITDTQRLQIADLMRQGHMGFHIDFEVGEPEASKFETIRVLNIKRITPSKETYTAGGDFHIITLNGTASLSQMADGFANPRVVEIA